MSSTDEFAEFSHALLHAIPNPARSVLQSQFQQISVKKSANIFSEGQDVDGLYFLTGGFIKITRLSIDGDQQLIDILRSDDIIGELAIYDDGPRSATATAMVDSTLGFVSKATFFSVADEYPVVYRVVLKALSQRLRETNHSFARSQFLPVAGQIASVLVRMAETMGEPKGDIVFISESLTRKEIASMIGAARENVSRTLSGFKKDGLIDFSKHSMTVKDIQRLKKMALI